MRSLASLERELAARRRSSEGARSGEAILGGPAIIICGLAVVGVAEETGVTGVRALEFEPSTVGGGKILMASIEGSWRTEARA